MINLTAAKFKEEIFDYTANKEWKYKGEIPAIIDFYADWCGPCKVVMPILDELAGEYKGKVNIYRVDTEVEQELSSVFGIRPIKIKEPSAYNSSSLFVILSFTFRMVIHTLLYKFWGYNDARVLRKTVW